MQQPVILPDAIVEHSTNAYRTPHDVPFRAFMELYHVRSGLGFLPPGDALGAPLIPFVSSGVWIVGCDICKSAMVAESTDPWFVCPSCGSNGQWRPVRFPPNKATIERLLLKRPGFRNAAPLRNYIPQWGDSEENLRAENRKLGIED